MLVPEFASASLPPSGYEHWRLALPPLLVIARFPCRCCLCVRRGTRLSRSRMVSYASEGTMRCARCGRQVSVLGSDCRYCGAEKTELQSLWLLGVGCASSG